MAQRVVGIGSTVNGIEFSAHLVKIKAWIGDLRHAQMTIPPAGEERLLRLRRPALRLEPADRPYRYHQPRIHRGLLGQRRIAPHRLRPSFSPPSLRACLPRTRHSSP